MHLLARSADGLVVLLWAAVAGYFFRRWLQMRRLVSIALAAMALGWVYIGIEDALPDTFPSSPAKGLAIALGILLWYAIWRVERIDHAGSVR